MIINGKKSNFLFYGLTPPKFTTDTEKLETIAAKQTTRINGLDIDALVLYDIQDESSRIDTPRPFPFMQTVAPEEYAQKYLNNVPVSKIIYQSVGKFSPETFRGWLSTYSNVIDHAVFVGAPSKDQKLSLGLGDAYRIKAESDVNFSLGGVTIPERHVRKEDEHERIFSKMNKGCSFFISQCVYDVTNTKNFLSDYYFNKREGLDLAPIIFTLTPCGSVRTLSFLEWLGIDIPKWLVNELHHSENTLAKSVEICKSIAAELISYCNDKSIPFGFNIESVAIRKEEIDASIQLLNDVKMMMGEV